MEQIIQEIEKLKTGLLKLEKLVKDTNNKRKREESSSSSKKPKLSLREEFILAGNDSNIFDSLHGKLSETQLRDIYKF
tara:strand:+ start:443 stop:676 length:234 start_codon:yes stop_codon:yes gene_type:complete